MLRSPERNDVIRLDPNPDLFADRVIVMTRNE